MSIIDNGLGRLAVRRGTGTLLKAAALAALLTGAGQLAAPEAQARLVYNALGMNGTAANGFSINGITLNGMRVNAIGLNGLGINGIRFNGIRFNGTADHAAETQGQAFNANRLHLRGLILPGEDGVSVRGLGE